MKRAALISFDICSAKFKSNSERNRFFRGLYGWNQRVRSGGKVYEYRREGLLDTVPHIKVDDSVFIVAQKALDEVMEYFEKWREKVNYKLLHVIVSDRLFEEKKRWREIKIR